VTLSTSLGTAVTDTTSAYSVSPSVTTTIGDIVIVAALAFEFSDPSPGSRTMAISSGWNQIHLEEFQLFPSVGGSTANRRQIFGCWWRKATSTSESATITLSGSTGAFLTLSARAVTISGIAGPYRRVGPTTRRENVDLGVGATPWTADLAALGTGEVMILVNQPGVGTASPLTPLVAVGSATLHTIEDSAPADVTYPNANSSYVVTAAVWRLTPGDFGFNLSFGQRSGL